MAVNKVIYGNETLIDITDTTATDSTVLEGTVFYNAAGVRTVGSALAGISDVQNEEGTSLVNGGVATIPNETFIVNAQFTDFPTGTADKHPMEIKAASEAGKLPVIKITFMGVTMIASLQGVYDTNDSGSGDPDYKAVFSYLDQSGLGANYAAIVVNSDKTFNMIGSDGPLLDDFEVGQKIYAALSSYVPTSRTINGKALTSNITLNATDVGALSTFTETDPTVPAWAKASTKPAYTYTEVGAAGVSHTHTAQDVGAVPSDTQALQINVNDSWHPIADWWLQTLPNYGDCVVLNYDIANDIWMPTLGTLNNMAQVVGQEIENVSAAIPTVVSDLDNDAGYITSAPTAVSQLTNDLNFATTSQVSTAITSAIGEINEFDVEVAAALPTENIKDHTIYFVAKESSENDIYDEFMYINNAWEHIGSTEVDLSNYVTKTDNAYRAQSIFYGEVDSTSTSTNFTATISGLTELRDGVCVLLKNGVVTSASGFTININGFGPKPSYSNMATGNDITPTDPTRDTTIFNINYTMLFIYSSDIVDGGGWICYRGYDANSNTLGYQLRTNSSVRTATDSVGRYRLLFTSASGSQWVPTTNSTSTNSTAARTVNQRPIDPFGDIVYYGSTTILAPNDSVSATIQWQQYTLNIGYSFNRTGKAQVMTYPAPVYVKCAPQSDGSAIIDADTPYVQALPSSADGKIYIYLGDAYSATNVELRMNHPVYYHDGTGIRTWNGKSIPTKVSELTDDLGIATESYVDAAISTISFVETDPTVPSWAKAASKPTYTYTEVGAASAEHTHTYTYSDVGAASAAHTHTYSDVGAASAAHTHIYTYSDVGAASAAHTHSEYATESYVDSAVASISIPVQDVQDESGASLVSNGVATVNTPFIVTITGSGTEASPYVVDKTYNEIKEAHTNGRVCLAQHGNYIYQLYAVTTSLVRFIYVAYLSANLSGNSTGAGTLTANLLTITNANVITFNKGAQYFGNISFPYRQGVQGQILVAGATSSGGNPQFLVWADMPAIPSTYTDVGAASAGHTHSDYATQLYVDAAVASVSVPSNISELTNDAGYISSYTETDPTVPAWAKASSKPTYTYSEVGAMSAGTAIPSPVINHYSNDGYGGNILFYNGGATTATITNTYSSGALTFSASGSLQIGKSHSDEGTKGSIVLSNTDGNDGYTTIVPTATGNKTLSLPAATGTLALTSQIPTVPTNVSSFTNDANYATQSYVDTAVASISVPSNVSAFTNDANYATESYVDSAVASISAPAEVFVINMESRANSDGNGYSYTKDKTFAEIIAAYNAGKLCILIESIYPTAAATAPMYIEVYANMRTVFLSNSPSSVYFTRPTFGEHSVSGTQIRIRSNEGIVKTEGSVMIVNTYNSESTYAMSGIAVASALSSLAIPSAVSELTNDSGYLTLADLPIYDGSVS